MSWADQLLHTVYCTNPSNRGLAIGNDSVARREARDAVNGRNAQLGWGRSRAEEAQKITQLGGGMAGEAQM